MNKFKEWERTCLRKKKLQEWQANDIIKRAEIPLRKYKCPHCDHWHITKKIK